MRLEEVMPYIVGRILIYHEPRNEMVDEDLLLGNFNLDKHAEYDECLERFGKFRICESGISVKWDGFDEICIILSK